MNYKFDQSKFEEKNWDLIDVEGALKSDFSIT